MRAVSNARHTYANYYVTGKVQERAGDNVDGSIPSGVYKTRDNQWVVLVCATDRSFEYATRAMNRPDLMKDYSKMQQRQGETSTISISLSEIGSQPSTATN